MDKEKELLLKQMAAMKEQMVDMEYYAAINNNPKIFKGFLKSTEVLSFDIESGITVGFRDVMTLDTPAQTPPEEDTEEKKDVIEPPSLSEVLKMVMGGDSAKSDSSPLETHMGTSKENMIVPDSFLKKDRRVYIGLMPNEYNTIPVAKYKYTYEGIAKEAMSRLAVWVI